MPRRQKHCEDWLASRPSERNGQFFQAHPILFYSILFYSILFYSILFYSIHCISYSFLFCSAVFSAVFSARIAALAFCQ
jgi:hypothetical protein